MFDLLKPTRRASPLAVGPGVIASLCLHGALVGAVVVEHAFFANSSAANSWHNVVERLTYIAPPDMVSLGNDAPLRYVTGEAVDLTQSGGSAGTGDGLFESIRGSLGPRTGTSALAGNASQASEDALDDAFLVVEVEQEAARDPDSAAPTYPPNLIQQGVEGHAAMRFVVDTAGRVDLMTVRVLNASRPEFAAAVTDAMPAMKFTPARVGDRPVRQLAEQLFVFEILGRSRPPQ